MFRVASRAKIMRPTATTQLRIMEFVIGKLKGRAISTAFADKPCSDACEAVVRTSIVVESRYSLTCEALKPLDWQRVCPFWLSHSQWLRNTERDQKTESEIAKGGRLPRTQ